MNEDTKDVVTRPKRNPNKKTYWGDKSDKVSHGKKTSLKRRLAEISDEDDQEDLMEYM